MSSFFLLKWGVQIRCLFSQNQTPRSDSTNLELSEPIFYPQMLEPRLGLTAWKQAPNGNRWTLRANPSSGALHPTEAYLMFGEPLPCAASGAGGEGSAGLYHYHSFEHALELRSPFADGQRLHDCVGAGFLLALSRPAAAATWACLVAKCPRLRAGGPLLSQARAVRWGTLPFWGHAFSLPEPSLCAQCDGARILQIRCACPVMHVQV